MLVIRRAQWQLLAQAPREQFLDEMLAHVRVHFPTPCWLLTPEELRAQVDAVVRRAGSYGLTSRRQACRFLNLAAHYGWAFDSDPGLRWMRDILTDTGLADPGERLDRLVQVCLRRHEIETRNLALRPQVVADDGIAVAEEGGDHAGRDLFVNTDVAEVDSAERLVRNPLGYHLSRSLWHGPEAAEDTTRGERHAVAN